MKKIKKFGLMTFKKSEKEFDRLTFGNSEFVKFEILQKQKSSHLPSFSAQKLHLKKIQFSVR